MIVESLSILLILLILGLMGTGLALVLSPFSKDRILFAVSIAPAMGLLIVGLLSFPLIKHIGPVHVWAKYFAAFFSFTSIGIIAIYRKDLVSTSRIAKMIPMVLAILICWFLLSLPILKGGIQFAIFGKNPADAFSYMTLSETFRTAEWQKILEGARLDNNDGMSRLAEVSPTALYSARYLLRSVRLATTHSFAWFSELSRIPMYKAYYPFMIFSFLLVIPLILYIGEIMHIPIILRYGALAPLVIGFWPQMLIDWDCLSQIQYISILLMFVIALYLISSEQSLAIRPLFLAAMCLAGSAIFYTEFLAFILTCLLIYTIMEWLVAKKSLKILTAQFILIIILSIAILLITDQLGYYSNSFLKQMKMGAQKNLGPAALLEPYPGNNPIIVFWGMIDFFNKSKLLNYIIIIFSSFLSILLGMTMLSAMKKESYTLNRILFSFILGSTVSFLFVTFTTREVYLMGKTLFFVLTPFAAMLLMTSVQAFEKSGYLSKFPILPKIGAAIIFLWLSTQFTLGIMRVSGDAHAINTRLSEKRASYNIDPIIDYLSKNTPERIHINIPSTTEWEFSLYCMFAFSNYKPFFDSGLVYDNNNDRVFYGLQKKQEPADYLIIKKGVDINGPMVKVAESAALDLYKTGGL